MKIDNRDELHAIASSKKFSSKNKALSEVRLFRKDPLREDEAGPEFEKVILACYIAENSDR